MIYRLELVIDDRGVRCVPLRSLATALEGAISDEEELDGVASNALHLLLEAVEAAEEVPLPGLTPGRADRLGMPEGIPGLELAEPLRGSGLLSGDFPVHPGAV